MSNPVPYEVTHYVHDHCLCLHLQRAARRIAQRFDTALRPVGLTNGQFSLLMGLNRPAPAAMRDVARVLAIDRTTLTAALKPLERRGLIASNADPADRRSRLLTLTAAGMVILAEAVPIWHHIHAAIDDDLPGVRGDTLRQELHGLT